MLSYLWKRNSTYYYRIKIPADLSDLFPTQLIRISLKTNDTDAAKVSAANVHRKVQNNFALLRSGVILTPGCGEHAAQLLEAWRCFSCDRPSMIGLQLLAGHQEMTCYIP